MKKLSVIILLLTLAFFQFCNSGKKAQGTAIVETKTNFTDHVKPLIEVKCAPCHITGNKSHIANYAEAKEEIDDIIRRISLNPGERGFMPARHDKLSDSAIAVFVKWKADGLVERN